MENKGKASQKESSPTKMHDSSRNNYKQLTFP